MNSTCKLTFIEKEARDFLRAYWHAYGRGALLREVAIALDRGDDATSAVMRSLIRSGIVRLGWRRFGYEYVLKEISPLPTPLVAASITQTKRESAHIYAAISLLRRRGFSVTRVGGGMHAIDGVIRNGSEILEAAAKVL